MMNLQDIIEDLKSKENYMEIVCNILKDTIKDLEKICKIQKICIVVLLLINVVFLFSLIK